jgi:hypothetical protein
MSEFQPNTFRKLFSSKTVWIPELFSAGWGFFMIQMHDFFWAKCSFSVAGAWVVLWWLCSATLYKQSSVVAKKKRQVNKDKPQTSSRYRYERNKLWLMRIGGVVAGCIATVCAIAYVQRFKIDYEQSLLYGRLYPATDADYGPCPVRKGLVNVHIGPGEYQLPSQNLPLNLVSVDDRGVLSLDKSSDGSMAIIADVRDETGKLIVRLSKDEFRVNPNNYFALTHPGHSRSEILVTDQQGNTVLDARYANDHTFSVTGALHAYGVPINLSPDNSVQGGNLLGVRYVCLSVPNHTSGSILNFKIDAPHGVEQ